MTQEQQQEIAKQFDNIGHEHRKAIEDLKTEVTAKVEEIKSKGFADPEQKEKIDRFFQRVDELDAKIMAPSNPLAAKAGKGTVGEYFVSNERYAEWKQRGFSKSDRMSMEIPGGFGSFETKTPIMTTNIGRATSGVQNYDRLPGVIQLQRQNITIRDLLRTQATTNNAVDWLKQNVATRLASPQTEGSAKAESTITYTTATANIRTIAHFIQFSRQALDDIPWLSGDIDSELMFGLKLKEEQELLSGDNLGEHLYGIIPQATAYAGTYAANGGTDTKLDTIRHFILEARAAYYPVDALVMSPKDLHDVELIKQATGGANTGSYILGDPKMGGEMTTIWGRPVVESDSIPAGKLLAGSFALGALLFDRQQASIDLSYEHSTNWTTNQVTIRCEERLGLAVLRPAAFRYGSI